MKLGRTESKILNNSPQNFVNNIFQIYLGRDEAFVNTIKKGCIDEIKIFPNRISEILQKYSTLKRENLLGTLLLTKKT